jgi:aromatic ring-opening dioxygenase catalytic subunit (LigB family)
MSKQNRMPTVYLPHGGGPWPFVDVGFGTRAEWDGLATYLRTVPQVPTEKPRAILCVSAHWEERLPTVQSGANPPLLFDYYGFPKESYELTWPAPGAPDVAARVRELLSAAGFESAANDTRGFDHGAFVPLKVSYPDAQIPTLQLSLVKGLDPKTHLDLGRALSPLRDEGIFIVGSGMSFHNMRGFGPGGTAPSLAFDGWLADTTKLPAAKREARLLDWTSAPQARVCHPREEHLLPLMVVAGAAGDDVGTVPFQEKVLSVAVSAHHFG